MGSGAGGIRTAGLADASSGMLATGCRNADVDPARSVEEAGICKPHPTACRLAGDRHYQIGL